MTAVHTVTVTADTDGTVWHHAFTCPGDADDKCRQWCAEGCEESCTGYSVHRWTPLNPPSCRIVDWLDAAGVEDSYAGEDEEPPDRSGVIAEEWTGDDYIWHYAPAPAEQQAPR